MLSRIVNRTFVFFAVVYLTVLFVACGTAEVLQEDYEKGLAAYETGDYTTATAHLMIAAEKDHPYAQFLLAQCFGNGKGVHVSSSRAAELRSKARNTFQKKAESGDPDAMYYLGVIQVNYGNEPVRMKGKDWLEKSASKGNEKAQKLIESLKKVETLKAAADSGDGDPDAMFELAEGYYNGITGIEHMDKAAFLFYQALENGRADAMLGLQKIASFGNFSASYLGDLARNGNKDAVRALIAGAEAGNAFATLELIYPVKQGDRDAMDVLVRLAEKGRSDAMRVLRLICVDRNEEAMDTLIRLAERGDANALDELGRAVRNTRTTSLTSNVVDVEWVEETAARTLLRLAKAGNKDAAHIIRELEKDSTEPTKELLKRLKQNN